jgi:hypothetical protein
LGRPVPTMSQLAQTNNRDSEKSQLASSSHARGGEGLTELL